MDMRLAKVKSEEDTVFVQKFYIDEKHRPMVIIEDNKGKVWFIPAHQITFIDLPSQMLKKL